MCCTSRNIVTYCLCLVQGNAGSYVVTSDYPDHLTITSEGKGNLRSTFQVTPLYVEGDNIFDYETADPPELTITVSAKYIGIVYILFRSPPKKNLLPLFVGSIINYLQ